MQLNLHDSCNHWFVKPCHCPVDFGTWVWKVTQKPTLKPREASHYHSLRHLRISIPLAWPSNSINRMSLTTGITATLMAEPIGCSPAVQTSSSAGKVTGPGISALWWFSYALAILRCWQDISTESGARTLPPVHTAMAPMRRQSTWCYSFQPTTRPRGISGLEENLTWILHASGTSWSRLGWWTAPWPGMREREKDRVSSMSCYIRSRSLQRWAFTCTDIVDENQRQKKYHKKLTQNLNKIINYL